ncbi:hypothetical protein LEP1GSC062_1961 [Leptospira alexanderi serovar Manhao 3 str. L 60]|uniref:Uncharacterized protein n=1 Tax=Leptospira alexanderi serovar Manhao 3 str. L 60 TaxID=1049759 RepID=V6I661_9LEPT|nr:hypothetical protein LEP1GSC062_1961 [Leptospira alexanderi serovar Manhao 3 str. L 60]
MLTANPSRISQSTKSASFLNSFRKKLFSLFLRPEPSVQKTQTTNHGSGAVC